MPHYFGVNINNGQMNDVKHIKLEDFLKNYLGWANGIPGAIR
jgi:hypothetical protein